VSRDARTAVAAAFATILEKQIKAANKIPEEAQLASLVSSMTQ
jgi:hypothetical protein